MDLTGVLGYPDTYPAPLPRARGRAWDLVVLVTQLAWISITILSKAEAFLWLCFKDKSKNLWLVLMSRIQRNIFAH